ncbi:hypothetical protein [Pseudomonas viridiflava]|uniref:Uncharacterized protein n=1 Tax=Pseudomonas viridiflava TaxID=33069 RepID=A0A3M5PEL3_PSEVI|nr:hypothetical protein [Pseudomonas viridiflava]RMT83032.1 hypothetical protein ALP40_200066 [Pseudomonas viridiflava]
MSANNLTFRDELKIMVKRLITHWQVFSVFLGGLGTLIGFYTIYKYTQTIGRPDLIAAIFDAKSALFFWLIIITIVVSAYLLILITTTGIFGLTASFLDDNHSTRARLTLILALPIALGITALIWSVYKTPYHNEITIGLSLIIFSIVNTALLHMSSTFRNAINRWVASSASSNPNSKFVRFTALFILNILILGTIVSAVFPALLIVKAYSGEDTPEAANDLMIASIVSACAMLIPVIAFYLTNANLFVRTTSLLTTLLIALFISIAISPGGSSYIVYQAAYLMSAREQSASYFLLTENYTKENFDEKTWGTVVIQDKKPVIEAFPLFSFGDTLLLCPEKFLKTERKDWPSKSPYCAVIKNSKAQRLPKNNETTKMSPLSKNQAAEQ